MAPHGLHIGRCQKRNARYQEDRNLIFPHEGSAKKQAGKDANRQIRARDNKREGAKFEQGLIHKRLEERRHRNNPPPAADTVLGWHRDAKRLASGQLTSRASLRRWAASADEEANSFQALASATRRHFSM